MASVDKKRPREEEKCASRKKQRIGESIQSQVRVPSIWLTTINEPVMKAVGACVSGYTTVVTNQKKRPREDDECISRKKQCTTPSMPCTVSTQGFRVQNTSAQTGTVSGPVGYQQHPLYSHVNPTRPVLPVQNNVSTRLVPVTVCARPQKLPKLVANRQVQPVVISTSVRSCALWSGISVKYQTS